jgi:uncharacterized protein YrrD
MPDPVSWFLIEPGWKVLDGDGDEVARVEEVVGDSNADIFNGLAIAKGIFSGKRYVPAEQVASITDGYVTLRLTQEQVDALGHYDEPPPSEEILPPDPKR